MKFLPAHSLRHSVYLVEPIAVGESNTVISRYTQPPRRLMGLLCSHVRSISYERVDHRTSPGPGLMSDSYTGYACAACGRILEEQKTKA